MKEIALPDDYSRPAILDGWLNYISDDESDPETGEPSPAQDRLAEALTNAYQDAINTRMPEGVEVELWAESRIVYGEDLYPELKNLADVEDEFDFERETSAAMQEVVDRFAEIEAATK